MVQANPAFVAADLLAQAEHDVRAQALLVTDSAALAAAVAVEFESSAAACRARASCSSRRPTAGPSSSTASGHCAGGFE